MYVWEDNHHQILREFLIGYVLTIEWWRIQDGCETPKEIVRIWQMSVIDKRSVKLGKQKLEEWRSRVYLSFVKIIHSFLGHSVECHNDRLVVSHCWVVSVLSISLLSRPLCAEVTYRGHTPPGIVHKYQSCLRVNSVLVGDCQNSANSWPSPVHFLRMIPLPVSSQQMYSHLPCQEHW